MEHTRRAHTFVEHTHLMRENMVATWKAILAQLVIAVVLAVGLGMPSAVVSSAAAREASDTHSLSAASAVRHGPALTEQDQTAARRKPVKLRLRNLGRDFRGHCRRAVHYVGAHFRRYDTAAHGGEPDRLSSDIDLHQRVADAQDAFNRALSQVLEYAATAPPGINREEALDMLLLSGALDGEAEAMELGEAAHEVLNGGTGRGTTFARLDVAAHGGGRDDRFSPTDIRAFLLQGMRCG